MTNTTSRFLAFLLLSTAVRCYGDDRHVVVDLGKAGVDTKNSYRITIKNPASHPMSILSARSSCDCLKIASFPRSVEPHQEAALPFTLTPGKTGELLYEINLTTGEKLSDFINYTLLINVEYGAAYKRPKSDEITVAQIKEKTSRKADVRIVDIRSGAEYEKKHIAGSINMPLYQIKTKPFLKNAEVVVVGNGFEYSGAGAEIRELNSAGWKIKALEGGIGAWLIAEGAAEDVLAHRMISPQEFNAEKNSDTWIVIDATRQKAASALLKAAVKLPVQAGKKSADIMKAGIGKEPQGEFSLLVFDDDGTGYDKLLKIFLEDKILKDALVHAYFLEGGIRAFDDFAKQQDLVLHPSTFHASSAKTPPGTVKKTCSTCP